MTGKIFVNYRRGDDPGFTQALYQRLEEEFTAGSLFMDVEGHIKPGDDFVEVLRRQVEASDILLAVIGPRWTDLLVARQSDPDDFVAIEIKAAIESGKRVIPVLVGGATMPRADILPETIRPLARRNAVGLRPERFKADCQGLVSALKEQLVAAGAERNSRSEADRKAAEQARRADEMAAAARATEAEQRARDQARAGISNEEIRKAEELTSWQFIEPRNDLGEVRDHLARFPRGVTERYALAKLDQLVWATMAERPTLDALNSYLSEFPNGLNSDTARRRKAAIEEADDMAFRQDLARRKETEEWGVLATSNDIAVLEQFIESWPGGIHAVSARKRIAELKQAPLDGRKRALYVSLVLSALAILLALAQTKIFAMSTWQAAIPPQAAGPTSSPVNNLWVLLSGAVSVIGAWGAARIHAARQKSTGEHMAERVLPVALLTALIWIAFGYSMVWTNGGTWNDYVGGLSKVMLAGVEMSSISATFSNGVYISELMMVWIGVAWAIPTACLLAGALEQRMRLRAALILTALWFVVVYMPLAHMWWYWVGPDTLAEAAKRGGVDLEAAAVDAGLIFKWGGLDFGGGSFLAAVGVSGLVATRLLARPAVVSDAHDGSGVGLAALGILAWAPAANLEANGIGFYALVTSMLGCATGSVTWLILQSLSGRGTKAGALWGAMAGVTAMAPASGFIGPTGAISLGLVATCVSYYAASRFVDATTRLFVVLTLAGALGVIGLGLLVNPDLGGSGVSDYVSKPGEVVVAPYDMPAQLLAQIKGLLVTIALAGLGSLVMFGVAARIARGPHATSQVEAA